MPQRPFNIRLLEGHDLRHLNNADQRYATLSHCWGSNGPEIKLKEENINEFRSAIPWDPLPLTFKEAIVAVHKLGLQYIWIDALCIIQNSSEDWAHESSVMTDVYSNCFVNISAISAADGRGGLFRKRDPSLYQPCVIPASGSHSQQPWCCHVDDWYHVMERGRGMVPLSDRAWVVQERFLAPRIVHFSEGQIHWECVELCTSENVPGLCEEVMSQTYDTSKCYDNKRLNFKHELFSTDKARSATGGGGLYRLWDNIVSEYSQHSITLDTDRPVAIAGLASLFCRMLHLQEDDYVCGLWRPRLLSGMMWITSRASGQHSNTRVFNIRNERIPDAPSWSWLSTSTIKELKHWQDPSEYRKTAYAAEIMAVSVLPLGTGNRFGSVDTKNSRLRIRAPLCQANIAVAPDTFGHCRGCRCAVELTIGRHTLREGEKFRFSLELTEAQHLQGLNGGLIVYLLAVFGDLPQLHRTGTEAYASEPAE